MGTGDPWLLVQHVAFEGPGTIATAVTGSGADLTVLRMDRGDPLPPPAAVSDLAGLVVMGGPMSVHEDLAWLADERALGPSSWPPRWAHRSRRVRPPNTGSARST